MSANFNHIGRLLPAHLRVCLLVLAALLFGQFTAAAHAHDAHDDTPVACDLCLSAYSEEDDLLCDADDEPDKMDPPAYILSSTVSRPEEVATARFDRTLFLRSTYIDVGRQSNAARAPPLSA